MGNSKAQFNLHQLYTMPCKDLGPLDIVQIQMKLLQQNDYPVKNHGLHTCYNFISPISKHFTGPIELFSHYVENSNHYLLLDHVGYKILEIQLSEQSALISVRLFDQDCEQHDFIFLLTKQKEGPHMGCWMLDLVEYDFQKPERILMN